MTERLDTLADRDCSGPIYGNGNGGYPRRKTSRRPKTSRRFKVAIALAVATASAVLATVVVPTIPPVRDEAAVRFLSTYTRPDGRVVRLDQGGDTVSEGQAYGMLLAEVLGDNGAFGRIWGWTHQHLQLPDGLFAWHANAAGKVIGPGPASDADLLIAWALLRYSGPGAAGWHSDGRRVAGAVLAREVTKGPGGLPVLTAGPWAVGPPAILDPSYWSLTAMQSLARLTGRPEWHRLAVSAVTIAARLTRNGRVLPPDWAEMSASGDARPEPAPNGSAPQTQYGPDAQRTVVWFAASCDARARVLAARWWRLLWPRPRARALALRLDGKVLSATPTAISLVASAAAAKAAGDRYAGQQLLLQAVAEQRSYPTYYGGAWIALGPALLSSRSLGAC